MAVPSKRRVCGGSLAGITGSNPAGSWMSLSSGCCVFCQLEVSAMGRSFVQRGPIECGVSEFDLEKSTMRKPRPTRAVDTWKIKVFVNIFGTGKT